MSGYFITGRHLDLFTGEIVKTRQLVGQVPKNVAKGFKRQT